MNTNQLITGDENMERGILFRVDKGLILIPKLPQAFAITWISPIRQHLDEQQTTTIEEAYDALSYDALAYDALAYDAGCKSYKKILDVQRL